MRVDSVSGDRGSDRRPSDLREVYAVLEDYASARPPAFGVPLGGGVLPSSVPAPTSSQALAITELAAEPRDEVANGTVAEHRPFLVEGEA